MQSDWETKKQAEARCPVSYTHLFFQKPHILRGKFHSVEVVENSSVRGKIKNQPVGVERLIGIPSFFIYVVFAVFSVPGQRMANGSEVGAYLMEMCIRDRNGVNATVLVKVEDKSLIAELKEDAECVDQLIGQLDLNQLSYSDKSSVEECRTAYNALSDRCV